MKTIGVLGVYAMFACISVPLLSQEKSSGACVNTYTNQTVSSVVAVLGCGTLTVQNVTVAATGDLSFSAPTAVTINGPFEVKSGGLLNIRQSQQMIFNFTYDAAGNRITRQFGSLVRSAMATSGNQDGGSLAPARVVNEGE